jgi:tetratricopeptide (TPR) repeat protein
LEEARRVAQSDPRLTLAVENAIDGQVIQYLAGAPALLSRFESAPPGARSLMLAAMDAQRLGHGALLPYGLLAEGAEGYLTDEEWDALADDWLETAMAYAAAPVAGVRGALVRRRPRTRRMPGQAASGDLSCYRLADYLDQHGRVTRSEEPVPETLWRALLVHGDRSGHLALGRSAERRGLLRIAAQFYAQAEGGARNLAQLLEACGRPEDAYSWWIRSTTETGDINALQNVLKTAPCETSEEIEEHLTWWWENVPKNSSQERTLRPLIRRLGSADDPKALRWWSRVAEYGGIDSEAERVIVGHLRETKGPDAVLAWYLERTSDTQWYQGKAADLLVELGRTDEAISLLISADPDGFRSLKLAELLLIRGKDREAVEWLAKAAQDSSYHHWQAVQVLIRIGERELALELAKQIANWNDRYLADAAALFEEDGRHTEALALWSRAATLEHSGSESCFCYARSLVRNNKLTEALAWYQRSVERGRYPTSELWEAELLSSQGVSQTDVEEWHYTYLNTVHFLGKRLRGWNAPLEAKLAWLFELVKRGHPSAMGYAIRRLCDAGRESEALEWALERADAGDNRAPWEVASLYAATGELDLALQWWERSAQQTSYGHAGYREGAQALRDAGRIEEAVTWSQRATEAGDVEAVFLTIELYERLGRSDEALACLWDLAERGLYGSTDLAADILQRAGRERDAERLRRYGWEPDGSIATAWSAHLPSTHRHS